MSGDFCGIDPPGLAALAVKLDWVHVDIDSQAGTAYERLTRHSHWATADGVGTSLSGTSRWARLEVDDLRRRVEIIVAAQQIEFVGGMWQTVVPPFPIFGPPLPGAGPLASGIGDLPWDEIEEWVRGALGVWHGRTDDTFPYGRWIFGNIWMTRVVQRLRGVGPIINGLRTPTIANGLLMRSLAGTQYFRWINNPVTQLVGKRVSIGLSAYATYQDAVVVWNHGNPIDAFEREGAGYVADVARLGFSASTTAFIMAPNPWTGGAVIITGLVWGGAELVDHWDEVSAFIGDAYGGAEDGVVWVYDETGELINEGWDWTAGQWNDFEGWGGEQWSDIEDWGDSRLDDLNRSLDWADDRLDDVTDWTGDRAEDIDDFATDVYNEAEDAVDAAAEGLETARDWTGDRLGDLGDASGEIVDAGGDFVNTAEDLGKKLIPGWG